MALTANPTPAPAPAFRRWAVRLAALAISTLMALAVVEVGLRLFRPVEFRAPPKPAKGNAWRSMIHRRSEVPGLAYELNPGATGQRGRERIAINSAGMRDDEPLPRTPELFRIAVVGDSSTFGFGIVDARDTYANVLERRLNAEAADGRRYEVLNLGVGGYGSLDEALAFAARAAELAPDLVIVGYSLNDPEIEPIQPLHAHFQRVEWWQRSHLLRLLAQARDRVELQRYGGGSYYLAIHRHPAKWGSVVDAFRRFAVLGEQQGFAILLAILPVLPDGEWGRRYRFLGLHEQVAAEGRAHGFQVIDLLPVLETHDPGEIRVSAEDFHPNERGHQLIADALFDRLVGERDRLLSGKGAP
ncbi:MAG TPA: SGNH/GDSL hydrolase family protein [Thermoanaerobaculia bacterium]|nr:SGNH/GDSL hydrolase family protein [Thermoanaerobaculia bacterium]